MNELRQYYRDACDKPGQGEWITTFFRQCELIGIKKVSEIMSGKRRWMRSGDRFERSCELILIQEAAPAGGGGREFKTRRNHNQKDGVEGNRFQDV